MKEFFNSFLFRRTCFSVLHQIISVTCLFLASKVEESPKRLSNIVTAYFSVRKKLNYCPTETVSSLERCICQRDGLDFREHKILLNFVASFPRDFAPSLGTSRRPSPLLIVNTTPDGTSFPGDQGNAQQNPPRGTHPSSNPLLRLANRAPVPGHLAEESRQVET
jgi:Cyclin, N-terminal domain